MVRDCITVLKCTHYVISDDDFCSCSSIASDTGSPVMLVAELAQYLLELYLVYAACSMCLELRFV